jgi:hypothetical protein
LRSLINIEWESVGRSLRVAEVDDGRELLDKTGSRGMTLGFVDGPVIADVRCIC